jgi:hypothetical protein
MAAIKSIITITSNFDEFDTPTATKNIDGKDVDLSIDELSLLINRLGWLLTAKVSQRAFDTIESGKLYYHMRNHHYYLAAQETDLLVFYETNKVGNKTGSKCNASYMDLPLLRLVAKQPVLVTA